MPHEARLDLSALAGMAATVAREAGILLASRSSRAPATVTYKGAADMVTEIDRASEALIRRRFAELTPDIPVQGEEEGGQQDGLRWVVDPLDGTTNFVHGYPCYAVSIGLVDDQNPIIGAIFDPIRARCYTAWQGGGASCDGAPIRVSAVSDVGASLGVTGFPNSQREGADTFLAYVSRALQATHGVRRSGSAAMDLAMLAEGCSDFFWEFGLSPWDTAAGAVLIREAGGTVTCLDGSPWHPGVRQILATNGRLHAAVIALLRG